VAQEVNDRSCWNEKCWLLIRYFEFLNQSFDTSVWDNNIHFIEDSHLRSIMGFFRLWIDTERLYLLNFLKLDSNEFQEDRIFMCLFRTLLFLETLFNNYTPADFTPAFLTHFLRSSIDQIHSINEISTNNDTNEIIEALLTLLRNMEKKERVLIEVSTLQTLKKNATIKVSKENEIIREVENRLKNSALFKRSLDEELRLKKISKNEFIEELAEPVRPEYDPIYTIQRDLEVEYYGDHEQKERVREEAVREKIDKYKSEAKKSEAREESIYTTIDKNKNNPYGLKNYQIYGEMIKIDMDDKLKYEKQKIAEVASIDVNDRRNVFYD
jgi:hypothetical protein